MSAAKTWKAISDVRGFLATKGNRSVGTHSPKTLKRIPWPVCSRCGLLYLKNERTRKAVREPCIVEE